MAFEYRWSQIVRTPGAAQVLAHHPVEVAPIGGETGDSPARPGVRLMWRPVSDPALPLYCDVTSVQAIAMLEGFLHTGLHVRSVLSWRSKGFGVHRRDTIGITPLEGV